MKSLPKTYRPLIIMLLVAIFLLPTVFLYRQTQPGTITLTSGDDLKQFLTEGKDNVSLYKGIVESGCFEDESDCFFLFDDIRISQEKDVIYKNNRPLTLVSYPTGTQTPDLDWNPLAAYSVSIQGERWGSCMEFSHSGLGQSGEYQRWTSTILIPDTDTGTAFKMTGYHWYQPSCEFLTTTPQIPRQLILSEISRSDTSPPGFALYRYTCTDIDCSAITETKSISVLDEATTISF
jgi:hypothetical protein